MVVLLVLEQKVVKAGLVIERTTTASKNVLNRLEPPRKPGDG
jgi:hypothetical protein